MNKAGADIAIAAPSSFHVRVAAVRPLVRSACGVMNGVLENEQGIRIFAPDGCAAFGPISDLLLVNGVNPLGDPHVLHAEVTRACQARASVKLRLRVGSETKEIDLVCTADPEVPAPTVNVSLALP